MSTDPSGHILNPALFPEPELTMVIKLQVVACEPDSTVSITLEREDGSWYLCTVDTVNGPTSAGEVLSRYLADGCRILWDAVAPF